MQRHQERRLTVRCLGGFEVRYGDAEVRGFESQKAKALLAYLLSHRGRPLTRDRLASLLWPERSDEDARRNLRQAVYNVKQALPVEGAVGAADGQLRILSDFDCWYDVEVFDRELARAYRGEIADPHALAAAAGVYRGDFLAGFVVKDSEEFHQWLTSEQERLRDKVLEALRTLVESYLSRGEFRFGVQYARRLIAIDPLAEEGHRYLMQLYALSGRRSQAIAQYEDLRRLLSESLDVEPLPETETLYQSILSRGGPSLPWASGGVEPIGPLVPLAGRHEAMRRLQSSWSSCRDGGSRLTLIGGEAGVGKSRLVNSVLHSISTSSDVVVVKGRCFPQGPSLYQPFAQVVRNALVSGSPAAERALRGAPLDVMIGLKPLVAGLGHFRGDLHGAEAGALSADGQARPRLYAAIVQVFRLLAEGETPAGNRPLAIFLDDLHLAGPETFDLLDALLRELAALPIWFVGAYRHDAVLSEPLRRLAASTSAGVDRLLLQRLEPAAVEEIAASLASGQPATELGRFLARWSEGLPIAIAEAINFLWDEGVLVAGEAGRWRLVRSPEELDVPASGSFIDLITRRFRRLPSSTRRLAALAAVMGQKFDTELLRQAADELDAVVEVGLELMLERWLIRRYVDGWVSSGREPCIVLWSKGARRGSFEFAHPLTWRAVYEELDPRRRAIMHGEVAAALEKRYGDTVDAGDVDDPEGICELLAHHFSAAGLPEKAELYRRRAARRARHLGVQPEGRPSR